MGGSLSYGSSFPAVATAASGSRLSSNVQAVVTSDEEVTFSPTVALTKGEVCLFNEEGDKVTKEVTTSVIWTLASTDDNDGLLTGSPANSKGYELFWIWGKGRTLRPVGLLNGAAWSWSLMPSGYTHRSFVQAFAATDSSGDLLVSRTVDGFFSYDGGVDLNEIDVVTNKAGVITQVDVDCSPVLPASRRLALVTAYFQNTNSSGRDAYFRIGTTVFDRIPSIANASGRTQIGYHPVPVPAAGLPITAAFSVELSGAASGSGLNVWALGAWL